MVDLIDMVAPVKKGGSLLMDCWPCWLDGTSVSRDSSSRKAGTRETAARPLRSHLGHQVQRGAKFPSRPWAFLSLALATSVSLPLAHPLRGQPSDPKAIRRGGSNGSGCREWGTDCMACLGFQLLAAHLGPPLEKQSG